MKTPNITKTKTRDALFVFAAPAVAVVVELIRLEKQIPIMESINKRSKKLKDSFAAAASKELSQIRGGRRRQRDI